MIKAWKKFLLNLVAVVLAATTSFGYAATPKDTFVMAKDIADIITMDPAEVFELTTGEIIANIYDRIMMFEPENLTELVGGVVESWEISGDGKTITAYFPAHQWCRQTGNHTRRSRYFGTVLR